MSESADILEAIKQRFADRKYLAPEEPPRIPGQGDGDQKPLGGLPPPPTQEDVDDIEELYEESREYMESAKDKLQTRKSSVAQSYIKSVRHSSWGWLFQSTIVRNTILLQLFRVVILTTRLGLPM